MGNIILHKNSHGEGGIEILVMVQGTPPNHAVIVRLTYKAIPSLGHQHMLTSKKKQKKTLCLHTHIHHSIRLLKPS